MGYKLPDGTLASENQFNQPQHGEGTNTGLDHWTDIFVIFTVLVG